MDHYVIVDHTGCRTKQFKQKGRLSGPKYKGVSFGEGNLGVLAVQLLDGPYP